MVNIDVPAGVGAPPLNTTPEWWEPATLVWRGGGGAENEKEVGES